MATERAQILTVSPPDPSLSISAQINAATRKQHLDLNRLITARLPLALPPHVEDPAVLGKGLAAFAQIFFAFESAWDNLPAQSGQQGVDGKHEGDGNRAISWLSSLRPEGLSRSERLMGDLAHIRRQTGADIRTTIDPIFAAHIQSEIQRRPHLLVAYAWVMYMAVFSGGRWIRSVLAEAGPEFWADDGVRVSKKNARGGTLDLSGMTFLSFEGEEDGEDIKREFKARLEESERLLSTQERKEVVDAAGLLFERCIALVHQLDRQIWQENVIRRVPFALLLVLSILALFWFCMGSFVRR